MRVTNAMISNRMLANVNRNLTLLDKYNTQGSTGKKIQVPSDDPIIASRSLKFRTMLSETEQYAKNASDASSWVDATESVFVNMNKILEDMKGLMTQGASDSYTLEDRQKLLTEYMSLLDQLEQELNSDYMGRSLFSGFRTDKKPIIKDDQGKNILNPEVYGRPDDPNTVGIDETIESIAGQKIEVQVGAGITVEVNSLATDIYDQQDYDALRGVSNPKFDKPFDQVLEEIKNLNTDEEKKQWEQANDLRAQMANAMKNIEDFQAKLSVQDTDIGVRSKRIELVQTRLEDDKVNYETVKSDNEDADIAEVMMNYNTANAAYTASLSIGMKITQITLADYLR